MGWTAYQLSDSLFIYPGPRPNQRVVGFLGFSSIGSVSFSPIGSLNGQTLESGFLDLHDAVVEPVDPLVDDRVVYNFRFDFGTGVGQDRISGVTLFYCPNGRVLVSDFFPTQGDFVLSTLLGTAGSLPLVLLALSSLVALQAATKRASREPDLPRVTSPTAG